MRSIFENSGYKAAQAQLIQLQTAHTAATLEQTRLLAQLSDRPDAKPSALDRAKAMLTGGTPAPRQDREGLNLQLTACCEKLALLGQAIQEQRGNMAGLVSAQSGVINAEAKQAHIKAAERIRTALAGLRDAMEAAHAIRAEIEAAGYQCSLEPLERPEVTFSDSQSALSRFALELDGYLSAHELSASKSANVRLLWGTGSDLPGDVLTMTGIEAAALVRAGRAELTRDKPNRVPRPVITNHGFALS